MGFIHQQYKFKMGFKDTKTNVNVVFVEICRWIPQVSVFLHKEWNKGTDVLYSNAQLQKCIKNLYGDLMYSHNCSLWTLSSITKPCLSLCCNYTAMATAPVCPPYTISLPSALKTTICKYQWNLVGKLDNDTGCHWLTKAQCPSRVCELKDDYRRGCAETHPVWSETVNSTWNTGPLSSAQAQDEGCQSQSTWLLPGVMGTAPPCAAKCPLSLTHLSRAHIARNSGSTVKDGIAPHTCTSSCEVLFSWDHESLGALYNKASQLQ